MAQGMSGQVKMSDYILAPVDLLRPSVIELERCDQTEHASTLVVKPVGMPPPRSRDFPALHSTMAPSEQLRAAIVDSLY